MVPEVAATVLEKPTVTSVAVSDRKIRRRAPEVPMPMQKCAQRLQTASSSVWPIYMSSPGHLKIAGDLRHLIHIEEYLEAIQELSDHIFYSLAHFESVV